MKSLRFQNPYTIFGSRFPLTFYVHKLLSVLLGNLLTLELHACVNYYTPFSPSVDWRRLVTSPNLSFVKESAWPALSLSGGHSQQ